MRIFVAVAHFFNSKGGGMHGSLGEAETLRAQALASLIAGLRQALGHAQGLLDGTNRLIHQANASVGSKLRIVVCTTGGKHLLHRLGPVAQLFEHRETQAEPMFLGFECHAALAEAYGSYDYYCFMEDDLKLNDPYFFAKLAWFNALAGHGALLQPNRFEHSPLLRLHKVYIDGNLAKPEMSLPFQDVTQQPVIEAEYLGLPVRFRRVNNPHSGCFFLNPVQMAKFLESDPFPDRRVEFAGPLESAATLGLMRHFDVYKPARENACFLELEHLHTRYRELVGRVVLPGDSPPPGHTGWKFST